jgi:hypothetical protein
MIANAHRGNRSESLRRRALLASIDHDAEIWPHRAARRPRRVVVLDGALKSPRSLDQLLREGYQAPACRRHRPRVQATVPPSVATAGFVRGGVGSEAERWFARDPLGKRPLYIHWTRSRMIFASDPRLPADPSVRLDPERRVSHLGFNPPRTVLKGYRIPGTWSDQRAGLTGPATTAGATAIDISSRWQSHRPPRARCTRARIFLSGDLSLPWSTCRRTTERRDVHGDLHEPRGGGDGGSRNRRPAPSGPPSERRSSSMTWPRPPPGLRGRGTGGRLGFLPRLAEAAGTSLDRPRAGASREGRWRWPQWSSGSGLPDSVSIVTGWPPPGPGLHSEQSRGARSATASSALLPLRGRHDRLLRLGHIGDREIVPSS